MATRTAARRAAAVRRSVVVRRASSSTRCPASRRDAGAAALLLSLAARPAPPVLAAEEDDEEREANEAMAAVLANNKVLVGTVSVDAGAGRAFQVPNGWTVEDKALGDVPGAAAAWGAFRDPVIGVAAENAKLFVAAAPKGVERIDDIGKVEYVRPAKDLGAAAGAAFRTADILASRVRVDDATGARFYDFDLAVPNPPESCNTALGCGNAGVELATATVRDGQLLVFSLYLNETQWKQTQNPLRKVRASFTTAAPPPA